MFISKSWSTRHRSFLDFVPIIVLISISWNTRRRRCRPWNHVGMTWHANVKHMRSLQVYVWVLWEGLQARQVQSWKTAVQFRASCKVLAKQNRRFAKGDRGGNQQGCDSMFQVSFTKCHFRAKFSFTVAAKKLRDQIPSAIFGMRILSGVFSTSWNQNVKNQIMGNRCNSKQRFDMSKQPRGLFDLSICGFSLPLRKRCHWPQVSKAGRIDTRLKLWNHITYQRKFHGGTPSYGLSHFY